MISFKGHFDGRVIVPTEQVDLPRDRELNVHIEPALRLVSGRELLKHAGRLDEESAREMAEAIKDCERIDGEW